jgi:hypothetical protein
LGRFIQADIIVPSLEKPQSFDRYAYVNNNAVRYSDPTGHCAGDPKDPNNPDLACWRWIDKITGAYANIKVDPFMWTADELAAVWDALVDHVFLPLILTARSITLYRREYGESTEAGATYWNSVDNSYHVFIYKNAYRADPKGNKDYDHTPESIDNFRGTVAHELTHVAVGQSPGLRESYRLASKRAWWKWSAVGHAVRWARVVDQTAERVALLAAVYEVDKEFIIDGSWEATWISSYVYCYR